MKVEDLMIGDWVQNEDGSIKGRIANINTHKNRVEFDDHTIDIEYAYSIPLTYDILKKNGFKKINQHDLFHIGTNRWGTNMWIEDNIIYIDSLRNDDTMISVVTCEYVHQFQHLLKDFEIEKEIVL